VKLKNELGALVDTNLWVAALQDVKARERAAKNRLLELGVEARLRTEERTRAEAAVVAATAQVTALQQELEKLLAPNKSTAPAAAAAAGADSASPALSMALQDEWARTLSSLDATLASYKRDQLEPAQKAASELQRANATAGGLLDKAAGALREEAAALRAALNGTRAQVTLQQKKLDQLLLQQKNISATLDQKVKLFTQKNAQQQQQQGGGEGEGGGGSGSDPLDPALRRELHEQSLASLTAVNMRINATNTSLARLKELTSVEGHPCNATATAVGTTTLPLTTNSTGDEACPTCGQELPKDTREQRARELNALLAELLREKGEHAASSAARRELHDLAVAIKAAQEQLAGLQGRVQDLTAEVQLLNATAAEQGGALQRADAQLAAKLSEKEGFSSQARAAELSAAQALAAAAAHTKSLEQQQASLRQKLDAARRHQQEQMLAMRSDDTKVSLAQDRIKGALLGVGEKTAAVERLAEILAANASQAQEITAHSVVLERLGAALGTRGIQNYVFQGVIGQLESITNAYLMVLAEGGIQLALQGDGDDDDRIVKSVWIRSKGVFGEGEEGGGDRGVSTGEFRERNLSQLSGGQWRRVSLALDLAFAELIRRRGVLRCNLMVMDEVLTHLDASGREAVGTVLRAMVQGPRLEDSFPPSSQTSTGSISGASSSSSSSSSSSGVEESGTVVAVDEFGVQLDAADQQLRQKMDRLAGALMGGGAYGTVLVILQDLAAAELEEAFDHVDVVVKEADASHIILDGEGED
jgi:DNA repair exonuclease SbcCD ATPase subunit